MSDPRAQLLEAARDLFVRQGYTQTTIQQLAEHAGISKGAVYLHFRSKSDVMLAVVRDHEDSVLDAVRAIALRDDLEPRDKLKAQLRYQFTEMHEERLLLEAFLKESGVAVDEELILIAQKTRREWQRLQEEFVRLAFPEHDPAFTHR